MINAELDVHERVARKILEQRVRAGAAFHPMLLGFRDDELLVSVIPPPPGDGDAILSVGTLMSGGFALDQMLLLADTYHSKMRENPVTGERWRHGEMGILAEYHNGMEKGWVTEALVLSLLRRQQSALEMRVIPYRRTAGGTVSWQSSERLDATEDTAVTGRLTTMMSADPLGQPVNSREEADREVLDVLAAAGCLTIWREVEKQAE